MQSKTIQLNDLFTDWKKSYKNPDGFSEDGIIDENSWNKAKRKILFLLKETNDYNGDFRALVKEDPWKVIGYWSYGLQNIEIFQIPSFSDSLKPENYKNSCISSAIMNLKKKTGEATADMNKVLEYAKRDISFIKKELEIIEPDVIVCCGTFQIVKKILPEFENIKPLLPDNVCYTYINSIWIDYCHPSARFRHDMMYYTLMMFYYNYLQTHNK